MRALKADWLRLLVRVGVLLPLAVLLWDFWQNQLTANPIQAATLRTGKTALVLMLLSLACTPINSIFGFEQALRLRRTLGLCAFAYATLHFLVFVGLDYGFDVTLIRDAIFEKRFAVAGLAAFLLLIPPAITSTDGWRRRLAKTWNLVHRGVYPAALLAVLHYVWQVKSDVREPLLYGVVVTLLLLLRLPIVRQTMRTWRYRTGSRSCSIQSSSE